MSKIRERALRADVVRLLDGTDLGDKVGVTVELVTTTDQGVPHAALLSVGEVLALGQDRLRLALWGSSETTANLRRDGRGLLTVVVGETYYGIEVEVRAFDDEQTRLKGLAAFDARVVVVSCDEVPYARLIGGISFELVDRAPVLGRWQRTVERLRALPEPAQDREGSS